MKRISVLIVVVFTIVFGGCAPESAEQIDLEAERVAILEIWPQYSSSLNSGDIDSWMSLWTEDGVQMPPNEPAVSGRDQIRARNKAVLDQFIFDMRSINNEEVSVAGDWAFARGTYSATLTPKEGSETISIDGKYMTILQKQSDGSWKIHRDIFNSNVPPAQVQ